MGKGSFSRESEAESDNGFHGTRVHVFDDPDTAEHWASVYEKAQYEGLHRFDPAFTWTPEEEKKVVRKVDLRIMFWAWLMFCSLDLNRRNINRAITDDMLPELGMNTNDFNYGQTMRGIRGWSGWQWLFLIEGLVTAIIGVLSWGLMPPGPCQTRSWFRGREGWFSEHEERILVNRLLRDDPSKGDMNNRQAVGPVALLKSLQDFDLWPLYLLGLLIYIPPQPHANYLSYVLRRLGFSTFHANLLAIPSQFMFAINLLIITRISDTLNERSIVASTSNLWILPCLIALVALPDSASTWARYAITTVLLSYPYPHAILVGWNARISNTVRTRAVSAALYNMCVQAGNIIGSNIFREDDSPLYRRGNKVLLAMCSFNVLVFYAVKAYYIWRNRARERKWAAMPAEEQMRLLRVHDICDSAVHIRYGCERVQRFSLRANASLRFGNHHLALIDVYASLDRITD
ncbi:hypothetical protein ETB97_004365 [Aspergillus alliaceus]|uniref:Uncharacterized protein n=1 Tax=Petromyces alliaceus TaxID=209559 RepID=A0A8H6E4Y3_PETAA|nr:hypothetical protein ETB97_004365 [Aspergillus burnettii]